MPPLVFPQLSTAEALRFLCNQALTLRLYSNQHTPAPGDSFASYTEVSGGGYAAIALAFANWTITPGSPSVALYSAFQNFAFSGAAAPNTVYGYYVTTPANLVVWAEQLFANAQAWVPGAGRTLQIRPRFGADNLVPPPASVV